MGKLLSNAEEDLQIFGDKSLNVHGTKTIAMLNKHEVRLLRKISLLNHYLVNLESTLEEVVDDSEK